MGLLFLFVAGCQEGRDLCPEQAVGIVEGTITGGGRPVVSIVRCESPGGRCCPDTYVQALSDSAGRYSLAVPAGDYLLRAVRWDLWWTSGGTVWNEADAETIHVGRGPIHADFTGGALTVQLAATPEDAGTQFSCRLHGADGSSRALTSAFATAADDGSTSILFPILPAGTYTVQVGTDYEWMVWLPPSFDGSDADRITLQPGEDLTRTYALPPPAIVDVRVRGSWQLLGPDDYAMRPSVAFFTPDSVGYGSHQVLSDGSYRAAIRAPIEFRLCVTIGSIKRWLGGWQFSEAQPLGIAPGDAPREIDYEESGIACTPEGPGFETDHEARYEVFNATGRRVAVGGVGRSDRPAALPNLAPGTYYLFVKRDSNDQTWAAQWYDQADSMSAATPIVVTSGGAITPITVHLFEGGRIRGRVRWSDGAAYFGYLCLRSPDGQYVDEWAGGTQFDTGTFVLSGLSNGEYLLGVPRGSRTLWHPGTWDISEAEIIRIVGHGTVEGIDLWVPR
jgi:hypothetical protein